MQVSFQVLLTSRHRLYSRGKGQVFGLSSLTSFPSFLPPSCWVWNPAGASCVQGKRFTTERHSQRSSCSFLASDMELAIFEEVPVCPLGETAFQTTTWALDAHCYWVEGCFQPLGVDTQRLSALWRWLRPNQGHWPVLLPLTLPCACEILPR